MSEEKKAKSHDRGKSTPDSAGQVPFDDELKPKKSSAEMVIDPAGGDEKGFEAELTTSLIETERQLALQTSRSLALESWRSSRHIVQGFKPVPWFIWRISNYVMGQPEQVRPLSEGLVLGLRRLIFAAASDPFIGAGQKVNNIHKALNVLPSDVIAAIAVLHAVCRKLSPMPHAQIWRPVLDEAIIRARLAWMLGATSLQFGRGRAMLSGFSTRSGLAVLIATGDDRQAHQALEGMASGVSAKDLGLSIYGSDPAQISSMLLSAAGCGRAASYGIIINSISDVPETKKQKSELKWYSSYSIIESLRAGKEIDPSLWAILNLDPIQVEEKLRQEARTVLRRGHGWNWLI
jgi:hypothetical protein